MLPLAPRSQNRTGRRIGPPAGARYAFRQGVILYRWPYQERPGCRVRRPVDALDNSQPSVSWYLFDSFRRFQVSGFLGPATLIVARHDR